MSFQAAADATSKMIGDPRVFAAAFTLILGWAVSGPIFDFSDTWQLIVNTGTTITTFLMVFLLQNSQNRDTASLHAKIDELIRALPGAQPPDEIPNASPK